MKNTAASIPALLLAGFFTLLAAAPAARAQFTFTIVAESAGPTFSAFDGIPSINAGGTVAFIATLDSGDDGVFTGNGGATTTIATTSGLPFSAFGGNPRPSINAAGTVAFFALFDVGDTGILTGNGVATTTIALTSGPTFSFLGTAPSINGSGTVAFQAQLDGGADTGIFTGNGGATNPIALSSGPTFSALDTNPTINAGGNVAFQGGLDAGGTGIFTGNGGAKTDIALSSGPVFSDFINPLAIPAINAAGTVAFESGLDAGDSGIFTGNGGATTPIALSSGPPFNNFYNPAINTAGTVAFLAGLDGPGTGIFIGNGGAGTRVIGTGSALNGSTVTTSGLAFGPGGLNDAGQIGFQFGLADGRTGIAVATPGQQRTSNVASGANYRASVPPITTSVGFGTTVDLLDGTAAANRTVTISFTAPGSFGIDAASELVNVTGTAGDTFVLQLTYDEAAAISLFGNENLARLNWLDNGIWKLAVEGNTVGSPVFVPGPYDNNLVLGHHGVDTSANTVWAVINHNSPFGVVPEPGTSTLLAAGFAGLALSRRRRLG